MKWIKLIILTLLSNINIAHAQLKLSVDTVYKHQFNPNKGIMRINIYNTFSSIIYIEKEQFKNIFFNLVVNDSNAIKSYGDNAASYFFVDNTKLRVKYRNELITPMPTLYKDLQKSQQFESRVYLQNKKLPIRRIDGKTYYCLSPNKSYLVSVIFTSDFFMYENLTVLSTTEIDSSKVSLIIFFKGRFDQQKECDIRASSSPSNVLKKYVFNMLNTN